MKFVLTPQNEYALKIDSGRKEILYPVRRWIWHEVISKDKKIFCEAFSKILKTTRLFQYFILKNFVKTQLSLVTHFAPVLSGQNFFRISEVFYLSGLFKFVLSFLRSCWTKMLRICIHRIRYEVQHFFIAIKLKL